MQTPGDKATLPVPKNLLYIDHDVPSSTNASPATTPREPAIADPLAAAGAGLKPPPPATNGSTTPPVTTPFDRLGKIGQKEMKLPDVHAEPHEYYGGTEVWTRARTFSNGNYMLSNLLQELALARDYGRKRIVLDEARLAENPVDRLSRMIKNSFWNALTRRIDAEGLEVACADPKNRSQHMKSRIYIPYGEDEMADSRDKPNLNLDVVILPQKCDDPEFVKSLNDKPGILALAMERKVGPDGKAKLEALPFIVPGARFNEKYGWDSYLCRSQPPFLTDLALQIYNQLDRSQKQENKAWLKRVIEAAIKEYHSYWMALPALDPFSGLSRYRPVGLGIPPETEASHFTHILQPYAQKLGISVNEYIDGYNDLSIHEPELDEYFLHDRGVRESGHDTTYRLDRKCADLGTVDLNSLLYKVGCPILGLADNQYEFDIASAIEVAFNGEVQLDEKFPLSPWPITPEAFETGKPRELSTATPTTSKHWFERAARRKQTMDELCWNEGHGMYYDYDTKAKKQARYESVTTLWPFRHALPKFEVAGGLVSGTEESRGIISLDRPNRQWDYPYSWPPHQIMAWVGLERYGFVDDAARLAYRWIYMMTLSFVDFNGVVPEKFDAVELSHMVDAE
ncbi:hypothetical protein IAU60_002216 [Kwoniella sp. DSM 27419]